MFRISEYLNQGMALAEYCLTGRPVLPTLMLYVTDACNSRCRISRLWQIKINAAARENGISYSKLIPLLKKADIQLDRKILADLAEHDPEVFKKIVSSL